MDTYPIATVNTGMIGGTEGSLEFVLDAIGTLSTKPVFSISWNNPFIGTPKIQCSSTDPTLFSISSTEKLSSLTEAHYAIEPVLSKSASSHDGASTISTNDSIYELPGTSFSDSAAIVPNLPYQQRLVSMRRPSLAQLKQQLLSPTSKCLLITLLNTSLYTLTLENHSINRGSWKKFPPNSINPSETALIVADFQGRTPNSGSVDYIMEVPNTQNLMQQHKLRFSWNCPLIGNPNYQYSTWSATYQNFDNRWEVELSLTNEESFVLDTEFVKIKSPTFTDFDVKELTTVSSESSSTSLTNQDLLMDIEELETPTDDLERSSNFRPASPGGLTYPELLDLLD